MTTPLVEELKDARFSRAMHFCMVSIFYPPYSFGGDALFVYRLSMELARLGHKVDVVHCANSYRLLKKTVDERAFPPSEGIKIHRLESPLGGLGPTLSHQTGYPLLSSGAIREIFSGTAYDVIHFHNVSLFGPGVFSLPAGGNPVRLFTAHDHWLVCPMSVLWKDGNRNCDGPSCLSCMLRSKRPPQWWRYISLLRRKVAHIDQLFAPSRFCAKKHAEYGFWRELEVLPYFVPDRPATPESPSPHQRPYFLFVGRLERYKGLQEVLPAFEGEGAYDLLVVGDGPYAHELRRIAAGNKRVRFVGWVNNDELAPYYTHALSLVVPSITYETFGLVVVEAFSRGVPAVVHDLGALPEVVREADAGFLYRNLTELREHLQTLFTRPQLRREMGARGRQAFETNWSSEAHLTAYFRAIAEVENRRRLLPADQAQ